MSVPQMPALWIWMTTSSGPAARSETSQQLDVARQELPEVFGVDSKRFLNGFAFDRASDRPALHPSPADRRGADARAPAVGQRDVAGNTGLKATSEAMRLHCARDDFGWDAIRYEVRDGRIFCDHTVVFPYLTDVHPATAVCWWCPAPTSRYSSGPRSCSTTGRSRLSTRSRKAS